MTRKTTGKCTKCRDVRPQKKAAKLPKTFLVLVTTSSGKSGYIRFVGTQNGSKFEYDPVLTYRISDASRYVGLDNSKAEARKLKMRYSFREVFVVDETTRKHYVIH